MHWNKKDNIFTMYSFTILGADMVGWRITKDPSVKFSHPVYLYGFQRICWTITSQLLNIFKMLQHQPSLKLKYNLKTDGWKTIVHFPSVNLASFGEGIPSISALIKTIVHQLVSHEKIKSVAQKQPTFLCKIWTVEVLTLSIHLSLFDVLSSLFGLVLLCQTAHARKDQMIFGQLHWQCKA